MDIRTLVLCFVFVPGLCCASESGKKSYGLDDIAYVTAVKDSSGEWIVYFHVPSGGALFESRKGDWVVPGRWRIKRIYENYMIIEEPLSHNVATINGSFTKYELTPNEEVTVSEQEAQPWPEQPQSDGKAIANLSWDNTQGMAFEFGLIDKSANVAVSVEPGVTGTKFHVGYGWYGVSDGFASLRATLTQLDVSKDNGIFHKGEKYTGIEFFMGVNGLAVQIGLLKLENGNYSGMLGFGVGF